MCRKLVFVVVFLAVLPVLMVSAKARGADPPQKKAGGLPPAVTSAGEGASRKRRPRQAEAALQEPGKLHGGEKAILKALKQKTSIDFVETPLKDVLDYLSPKHRIPIRMDASALKEAGVDERRRSPASSPASPCVRPWRSSSTSFSSSGPSIMTCS